jgi:hypothetical protein
MPTSPVSAEEWIVPFTEPGVKATLVTFTACADAPDAAIIMPAAAASAKIFVMFSPSFRSNNRMLNGLLTDAVSPIELNYFG